MPDSRAIFLSIWKGRTNPGGKTQLPLKDLRPEHLRHLYNDKLAAGCSARTVRYVHQVIHGALEQALEAKEKALRIGRDRVPDRRDCPAVNFWACGSGCSTVAVDRVFAVPSEPASP